MEQNFEQKLNSSALATADVCTYVVSTIRTFCKAEPMGGKQKTGHGAEAKKLAESEARTCQ